MIGRLQGILLAKEAGEVLLDVNGVGYEVEVPDSTAWQLPERGHGVVLYTHFVVREDAQHLYGFTDQRDRTLFRLLIKVNGIGPRLALGILSGMDSGQFVACVTRNDVSALVKLPGVGRKTAERLVIEMRDRLQDWVPVAAGAAVASAPQVATPDALQEAETALVSLGYKPAEAARAVMGAASQLEEEGKAVGTEALVRLALRQLGRS